ncbi:MAG: META domain-containing protein [Methanoregula sp.]
MRKLVVLLAFLVIAAVMITGCTSTQPAAQPTPATLPPTVVVTTPAATPAVPAPLAGDWIVTRMGVQDGTAVTTPITQISLTFMSDGTLTGYDGCNNYYASYAFTGQTTPKGQGISINNVSSSKKYCSTLANQETMYLNILGNVMAYNVDGVQLSMTASTGDVLIYQRPATLVTPVQYSPQG